MTALFGLLAPHLAAPASAGPTVEVKLLGRCDAIVNAQAVAVSGNYAYVADLDYGLRVVDHSVPAQPVLVGGHPVLGRAVTLAISTPTVFLGAGPNLHAIDVSDSTRPQPRSIYETRPESDLSGIQDLVLVNRRIYLVISDGTLEIIDVEDVAHPKRLGAYSETGEAYYGVAVSDNRAYVIDAFIGSLEIMDCSSPSAPRLLGSANLGGPMGITISNDLAFVANAMSGLQIVNVSNPERIARVSTLSTPGAAYNVALAGSYAVVADYDKGLQVIDASNPSHPRWVGGYDTDGTAIDVVAEGDRAWLADGKGGLLILQLNLPADTPPVIHKEPQDQVFAQGGTAYFRVAASGAPPLAYTWRSNNIIIPNAHDSFVTLTNLAPGVSAEISATITNAFGSATSRTAWLIVPKGEPFSMPVPASADPWLAGSPTGTQASGSDSAPEHSPVEAIGIVQGTMYWFLVTGAVTNPPSGYGSGPDGDTQHLDTHYHGFQNGIGNVNAPINALMGVFLDDASPVGSLPEPPMKDYALSRMELAYEEPQLRQPFLIGDGWNSLGFQRFIAPLGATRLFLGTMDAFNWSDNKGTHQVQIAGRIGTPTFTPRILQQPVDQFVSQGGEAVFAVNAIGTKPMRIQWYRNHQPVENGTNAVLTQPDVQPSFVGDFVAVFSNAAGSATSRLARLTVRTRSVPVTNIALGKPVSLEGRSEAWMNTPLETLTDGFFLPQGTGWTDGTVAWNGWIDPDATVVIDLHGTFLLEGFVVQADDNDAYVVENFDPTSATWRLAWKVPNYNIYQGTDVTGMQTRPNPYDTTQRYPLSVPILASRLRLRAAPGEGDSWNSVSEIQAWGSSSDDSTLAPWILIHPDDQTAPVGETIQLSVVATGTTPLSYQWWNSRQPLPGATSSSLVIARAVPQDTEDYQVVISNALGSATSHVARITVDPNSSVRYVTNVVMIQLIAGPAIPGVPGFENGVGTGARFHRPQGLFHHALGNLYLADTGNHAIRTITPEGWVATFAGSGSPGYNEGPTSNPMFQDPSGVCLDLNRNQYIADTGNHRIQKISSSGIAVSIAGPGENARPWSPVGIVIDPLGNLYFSDFENHILRRIAPDGTVTSWAGNGEAGSTDGPASTARFDRPAGLALDAAGNLYVAEYRGQRIRRVTPSGNVSTVAGTGKPGYVDGPSLTAQFYNPTAIAVDPVGTLFVADSMNGAIRRVSNDGLVETVAGPRRSNSTGGKAEEARLKTPAGIAIDGHGALSVSDSAYHKVQRVVLDPAPVRFLTHPQSQSVPLWSAATLSVTVSGTSPFTFRWYRDGQEITTASSGTLVLDPVLASDAGSYSVIVSNFLGSVTSDSARLEVSQAPSATLINGNFELPRLPTDMGWMGIDQNQVPGWRTTATDGLLEFWNGQQMGTPSYQGDQHLEVNAYMRATLYQDVTGFHRGAQLGFTFAHRSREGPETLALSITDLGSDGLWGGSDDTVLFRKEYSTDARIWFQNASKPEAPIVALGNPVRIAFEALTGDSIGNLLDAVEFGPGVAGTLTTNAPPVIFTQPDDLGVAVGDPATLSVLAAGGSPLSWLWSHLEGPMSSTNPASTSLHFPEVQLSDAGHYFVFVANPYGSVTSLVVTLHVSPTPRPRILSVSMPEGPHHVLVVFSTPVDPASATLLGNYSLADQGPVQSVEFVDPVTVRLGLPLLEPGWYTLLVRNVRSAGPDGVPIDPNTRASFALTDGQVWWSIYNGVPPDQSFDQALANPRFSYGWVSRSGFVPRFESPSDDQGAFFLGRLKAFIYPPVTGSYRFWLAADEQAVLYLSSNEDPLHKRVIVRTDTPSPSRQYSSSSDSVPLVFGQRYYLEAAFLERDGADGVAVAWQVPGLPPPNPGDPPIGPEYLSSYPSGGIALVSRGSGMPPLEVGQPWELVLAPADIVGSPPYSLQWTWNGTPIPGADQLALHMPWAEPSDAGVALGLSVSNAFGISHRTLATLSILTNDVPPRVVWVEGNPDFASVTVHFSEAISLTSAGELSHFSLSGGPSLLSATRDANGRAVILQTSPQTPGATYELVVRDLVDLEGTVMTTEQRFSFPAIVERPGEMIREVWRAYAIGIYLDSFLSLPAFVQDKPTSRTIRSGAEAPSNDGDHYGQRLSGWLVPPVSGEYRLTLAAANAAVLYLGRDARRQDLDRVAYHEFAAEPRDWKKYPTQTSPPLALEAGKAYAFEALMCAGLGTDHLALGWIQPGNSTPTLIAPSALVLRLDPRDLQPTLLAQPRALTVYAQVGGTFAVQVRPRLRVPAELRYQWERNGMEVPGAREAEYQLPVPLNRLEDDGAKYRCVITDAAGNRIVSSEATLTVLPQADPVRLHLVVEGSRVVLTWPPETGVRLQQATRLRNPDWRDVPETLGQGRFETHPSTETRVFRLWK